MRYKTKGRNLSSPSLEWNVLKIVNCFMNAHSPVRAMENAKQGSAKAETDNKNLEGVRFYHVQKIGTEDNGVRRRRHSPIN